MMMNNYSDILVKELNKNFEKKYKIEGENLVFDFQNRNIIFPLDCGLVKLAPKILHYLYVDRINAEVFGIFVSGNTAEKYKKMLENFDFDVYFVPKILKLDDEKGCYKYE